MLLRLRREKKGFTLIELIMVIVILGIVAAVAVPKFLSLKSSATDGVVRGVHGAMQGTIQQLQAQFLLDDITSYAATDVVSNTTMQGATLASSGTSITATIKGKTYIWTFTAGSGDAAAMIVLGATGTGSTSNLGDIM
ncbi:MAG: prepilin-type N-terminal cleavage/methylation domain-containing protein [Candidatus Brocadiales bacterium]